ncbi:MAG: GHKL domain-containing protein [Sedimentisphaerales bacterium]|nr:GHKL domain-containing protein [Sedimentisphaerales bacterium]
MKKQFEQQPGNQLWWVVSLLAIVVILPTVCLLWFMVQAVRNERLAVRQKLVDLYDGEVKHIADWIDNDIWQTELNWLARQESLPEDFLFQTLIQTENSESNEQIPLLKHSDAIVIYSVNGEPAYPRMKPMESDSESISILRLAQDLEYTWGDYSYALQEYNRISEENEQPLTRLKALIGKVRCLWKMGLKTEALASCRQCTTSEQLPVGSVETANLIAQARMLLVDFSKQAEDEATGSAWQLLINTALTYDPQKPDYLSMDSETRLLLLNRILESDESEVSEGQRNQVLRFLSVETRSLQAIQKFYSVESFQDWLPQQMRRIDLPEETFGVWYRLSNHRILVLYNKDSMQQKLQIYRDQLQRFRKELQFSILDNTGASIIKHEQGDAKAFLSAPISSHFPNWTIELFPEESELLDKAAERQIAIYTWGGILVIGLVLVTGGLAGQTFARQVKVNRLKNDFIATVTHELKTPLASMRMLVDTLLEGRYKDQQQVREYLELVSGENKRLSRLIDNFLSFSRMERNKHAFEIRTTDAGSIAGEAAEAVRGRFEQANVDFTLQIPEKIPQVQADPDAMVTVLVNLLDNAYKYSGDNKQISLQVIPDSQAVYFEVHDNGRGMTPRVAKRIFDRFYQADQTLSRTAEGCGLGLSIVKYIVDVHHGRIDVVSEPGKGSSFRVRIPTA